MNKKEFSTFIKKVKMEEIRKELNILEKSELNKEQLERMCFLLDELEKLGVIPKFDVKKGWKEFERDYLPIAEKFLKEEEMRNKK